MQFNPALIPITRTQRIEAIQTARDLVDSPEGLALALNLVDSQAGLALARDLVDSPEGRALAGSS